MMGGQYGGQQCWRNRRDTVGISKRWARGSMISIAILAEHGVEYGRIRPREV